MRVWNAAFGLALEPILRPSRLWPALFCAFCTLARFRIDEAMTVPGVTSRDIYYAIMIALVWTLAGAVALGALWAIPATIWIRSSIARSNRVSPKQ